MSIFDDLIQIDDKGAIGYVGWVEWQDISIDSLHCPICSALDKCWFNNILKPKLPQHEKCHCFVKNISKPLPNVNSQAICDLKKFTDYIFNDKYAWNGKQNLFKLLGFKIFTARIRKTSCTVLL